MSVSFPQPPQEPLPPEPPPEDWQVPEGWQAPGPAIADAGAPDGTGAGHRRRRGHALAIIAGAVVVCAAAAVVTIAATHAGSSASSAADGSGCWYVNSGEYPGSVAAYLPSCDASSPSRRGPSSRP